MIFIIGFIGLLICAVIVYKFLTGGQSFRVYTSRDFSPPEDEEPSSRRMVYTEDDPEVVSHRRRRNPDAVNVAADEEEIEEASEIIELPATALRKDDETENTEK
ncbi:MAG: hypothetical protein LIO38_03685 [Cloacibacillus sp.]|nr:hypothetical protein [Cloacibacillus sp.]